MNFTAFFVVIIIGGLFIYILHLKDLIPDVDKLLAKLKKKEKKSLIQDPLNIEGNSPEEINDNINTGLENLFQHQLLSGEEFTLEDGRRGIRMPMKATILLTKEMNPLVDEEGNIMVTCSIEEGTLLYDLKEKLNSAHLTIEEVQAKQELKINAHKEQNTIVVEEQKEVSSVVSSNPANLLNKSKSPNSSNSLFKKIQVDYNEEEEEAKIDSNTSIKETKEENKISEIVINETKLSPKTEPKKNPILDEVRDDLSTKEEVTEVVSKKNSILDEVREDPVEEDVLENSNKKEEASKEEENDPLGDDDFLGGGDDLSSTMPVSDDSSVNKLDQLMEEVNIDDSTEKEELTYESKNEPLEKEDLENMEEFYTNNFRLSSIPIADNNAVTPTIIDLDECFDYLFDNKEFCRRAIFNNIISQDRLIGMPDKTFILEKNSFIKAFSEVFSDVEYNRDLIIRYLNKNYQDLKNAVSFIRDDEKYVVNKADGNHAFVSITIEKDGKPCKLYGLKFSYKLFEDLYKKDIAMTIKKSPQHLVVFSSEETKNICFH